MKLLKEWMETVEYKITEGSDYGWNCFGTDAYRLDSWDGDQDGKSFEVVFNCKDQSVCELTAHDFKKNIAYRWINPEFRESLFEEVKSRSIDDTAWDNVVYTDLELAEDYFEKARAMFRDESFDERIIVPLELEDTVMFELMKEAHRRDVTLNELVSDILRNDLDKLQDSH